MYEVREVLRLWLAGRGLRSIAEMVRPDRKTVRRIVQAAVDAGLVRDRGDGISFVEILVSIVLLGMVVTAILATLNTSIASSSLNRNHANAHAWLQSASDILYGSAREDCGTELATAAQRTADEVRVRNKYTDIVRTTSNPESWADDRISVLQPVLFWDGDSTYQTTCYDDGGVNLQLITIEVRDPEGRIVESVQVVKG